MDGSVGPGPGPGIVPGPGLGTHDSAFTNHEPNKSPRCQLKASNDKESRGRQYIFPRPVLLSCVRKFVSLKSGSNCDFEMVVNGPVGVGGWVKRSKVNRTSAQLDRSTD